MISCTAANSLYLTPLLSYEPGDISVTLGAAQI